MLPSFANKLDALSQWRSGLESSLGELSRFLFEHDLLDPSSAGLIDSLVQRLSGEKLVVAFVAEFSRGKSELINAIFFADTGRRILPATPGRTTMCPVELGCDPDEPPSLRLLDIATRLGSHSLAELRAQPSAWQTQPLNLQRADLLAEALTKVMQTRWVPLEEARSLGFWDDTRPQDNPARNDEGLVEVPAWRHALINYPHPLLRQGLVVLDTPGLNAIGAEPELTVSLLPSAHATVFILAADTGVTKSDLAIWREHLCGQPLARYVALNKIDTLVDPLSDPQEVDAHISRQCAQVAQTLDIPAARVFALSARQALAARVAGDADMLRESRLLALEDALARQLLPQRREVLRQGVLEGVAQVGEQLGRRLRDQRRQMSEHLLELRGLRGKNSGMVDVMLRRIDQESAEFEQCTARVQAMRSVHTRMLREALLPLSGEMLREQTEQLQDKLRTSLLNFGARRSFAELCTALREQIGQSQARGGEIHDMLAASFARLNAEFGFGLAAPHAPDLSRFVRDLDLIEANYVQYLGLSHALRLSQARFLEQFRRMLVSKLRVVFESASNELELWNKTASAQIDSQLRERRRNFKRRRAALERVQGASHELEARIGEVEAQEARLRELQARLAGLLEGVVAAASAPAGAGAGEPAQAALPLTASA